MNKLNLIFAITFFTFITLNSQNTINFGVKGGINFANMTSDYFAKKNSKTEFNIGIFSEISLNNKFSIQPEILYSKQGTYAYIGRFGGGGYDKIEYIFDYIQIPILAKIYIYKNLSIELGPSFNFLIEKEHDIISFKDKNFEFSCLIGTSYKFKNGLFGSARYIKGMSDAIKNYAKNNCIQLGVGVLF